MNASNLYATIISEPPNNPGYLAAIPQPIAVVDCAIAPITVQLSASGTPKLWFFVLNFNNHAYIKAQFQTITAITYTAVLPSGSLIITSNSLYNNQVGLFLGGGTAGTTYTVVIGVTLSGGNVIDGTFNLTMFA